MVECLADLSRTHAQGKLDDCVTQFFIREEGQNLMIDGILDPAVHKWTISVKPDIQFSLWICAHYIDSPNSTFVPFFRGGRLP